MNIKFLLPVFFLVLVFYHKVLGVYFSQDDFFHFKVSLTDGSLMQFVKLFGFPDYYERGYAFYRPVFREGFYNIYYSMFGLDHIAFKVISLLIHFVNIYLVYAIILRLFKSNFVSLFAVIFFALASYNVGVLFYTAGGIETSGATMFILATLISFDKYLETKVPKYKTLTFLFFLLALGSHEMGAVLPLLLVGLIWVRSRTKEVISLVFKHLRFLGIIFFAYLYLDIVKIGFLQAELQYKPIFSLSSLANTYMWYIGWAVGLPEMLVDFVNPGFILNPSLMRHWGNYFSIIFPLFFMTAAVLGIVTLAIAIKRLPSLKDKRLIFLLIWFPAALFPIALLPQHKFVHYLASAMPAFAGILGYLVYSFWKTYKKPLARSVIVLFVVGVAILNFVSIKLGSETYWAATRGRIALKLINGLKAKYPQIPLNSAIYFKNDPDYPFVAKDWGGTSKQASFILNNQDAAQLIYKDFTLKTFYQDLGDVPERFPKSQVYEVVAKIN